MFNPWLIIGVIVAVLSAATVGYFKGRSDENSVHVAAALAKQIEVTDKVIAQSNATEAASTKAEEHKVEQQIITRTIIKEVPVYVTKEADSKCVVNRGFIRLLNDSAAGVRSIPESAGKSDGSPADIELDSVGSSIAANYGACREVTTNYADLQAWVRAQQELGSKPR